MEKQRIDGLDVFRGLALVFMISYHFIFDLNHFNLIQVDINQNPALLIYRYMIMSMFILSAGMSLVLAHQHTLNWRSVRKRIIQLGLAAMAVSISTYIVFPDSWIYFGILHFIFFTSLLVLPIIKFPNITLILLIITILGSLTNYFHMHHLFALLQEPLGLPSPKSQDLVPLFPWLIPLFTGMLIVQQKHHKKIFNTKLFQLNFPLNRLLKKMGQNSLLIYLTHQPILFFSFDLYFRFFSK